MAGGLHPLFRRILLAFLLPLVIHLVPLLFALQLQKHGSELVYVRCHYSTIFHHNTLDTDDAGAGGGHLTNSFNLTRSERGYLEGDEWFHWKQTWVVESLTIPFPKYILPPHRRYLKSDCHWCKPSIGQVG